MKRLGMVIRSFVGEEEDDAAMVSSMYAGRADFRCDGRRVARVFAEIAHGGHGSTVSLGSGSPDELERRLLLATLGWRDGAELDQALASLETDPRRDLVRAKQAMAEVDWLLGKLKRRVVHPDVVQALIELSDHELRAQLRAIHFDPSTPESARGAARYVLRKSGSSCDR